MSGRSVIFIAFEEFDNLGVGYVASALSEEGYEPFIIDFRNQKAEILEKIRKLNPLIVGFSVIFQYYIHEYQELIIYLRKSGITAHFSAGGQYASMRYAELFKLIPSIDSIVRFEGEYSFLELVKCIYSGADWRNIKNLVYKENNKIIVNPLRPPELDIDKFPFPMRSPLEYFALYEKYATIIASRGCVNNCSFCNNTEYIRQSLVPNKRVRKPDKVVDEIEFLHNKKNCSIFLFEDDDFPVKTKKGSDWIHEFCKELNHRNLVNRVMWKINCRPDQIEYDAFSLMKSHGLFLVFVGIDDGTDCGLTRLNKHMTVAESLRGVSVLKELEIGFDYGFMLFQPESTFKSVNDNLDFLKLLCSDGFSPVTFLKLIPFFDTRIEKELEKEGRLKGKPGFLDYDFHDNSLNVYYKFIENTLMEWTTHPEGLTAVSKWARNYISVFSHFFKMTPEVKQLSSEIRKNTDQSNMFLLDTMKELSGIFDRGKYDNVNFSELTGYRDNVKEKHDQYKEQIGKAIKELCRFAEYQKLRPLVKF
jgi:anaerobic magnesium-protoporphyrin IX monomethyl ester cyclase